MFLCRKSEVNNFLSFCVYVCVLVNENFKSALSEKMDKNLPLCNCLDLFSENITSSVTRSRIKATLSFFGVGRQHSRAHEYPHICLLPGPWLCVEVSPAISNWYSSTSCTSSDGSLGLHCVPWWHLGKGDLISLVQAALCDMDLTNLDKTSMQTVQ